MCRAAVLIFSEVSLSGKSGHTSFALQYLITRRLFETFARYCLHSMITLEFKMIEKHLKGPGSWKLNVSLLMNEHYVNAMESNIPIWKEDSQEHFADSKMSWEWIKFKIREFSLDFSKKLARKKREKESALLKEYETLKAVHELNPSDESLYKLEKIKSELELLEEKRIEGTIVRVRARWNNITSPLFHLGFTRVAV